MWFLLSHVGPHVRLLDPPKHVSDPQVPGHHWWRHLPSWQPHAGTKSCDEVRWDAPLLLSSPHIPSGRGTLESSHYPCIFSVALHVSLGTFSGATIVSLVVEQWTPGDYSALLHRGLARSPDPLCSIRLLLFLSSLSPPRFLPLNLHPTSPIYFSISFFAPFAGSKPSKVVAWQSTEGYARVSSSPTPPAPPPSLSQMTRWRFQVEVRLSAFPSIRLCCTSMHGRVVPHLFWHSSWPPFPQPCTPLAPSARFLPSLKPPSPLPISHWAKQGMFL